MLANPPFGVEWKQQHASSSSEQNLSVTTAASAQVCPVSTMARCCFFSTCYRRCARAKEGGSRICIVFNGSPFSPATPAAARATSGSGSSRTTGWKRRCPAGPALLQHRNLDLYLGPDQPQGASVRGKMQLVDARQFFVKMKKSLGNKRNKIGDLQTMRANRTRSARSRASMATFRMARPAGSRSTAQREDARSSARSSTTPISVTRRSPSSARCG